MKQNDNFCTFLGASKHDSACAQASGLKLDQNVEEDFHVEECVKEEWER